jgi:type VI secretion system secreted protein Hcp
MAHFDAFLKIEGVDGESADKDHKGEIEIHSFSWGETQAGGQVGGGGGTGKVSAQDFNFTMPLSKASPALFVKCATGAHIPSAQLTCRKAGGEGVEFLKIKLSDVLVSSYQTGGSSDDDFPADQLSINFARLDFVYTVPRTEEVVEGSFDFRRNAG